MNFSRPKSFSVACNLDQVLFWDPVYLTTATHKLIGELAFSALWRASLPEPSAVLGVLAFSALGTGALQKLKQIYICVKQTNQKGRGAYV